MRRHQIIATYSHLYGMYVVGPTGLQCTQSAIFILDDGKRVMLYPSEVKLIPHKTKWKDVTGYEELYEVSNGGNIRNKKTKQKLSTFWNERKYLCVILHKNGVRKKRKLHRLVAIEHCPNPDNKPEVNHLGKKNDLRWFMLQWSTREENLEHMRVNGLTRGKSKRKNGKTKVAVH